MVGKKIKLQDRLGRVVRVNSDGTKGATVGKDLRWPDGTLVNAADIRNPKADAGSTGGLAATVWKLIREIPANIQKLAKLVGTGFTTRSSDGEWYQRSIAQGEGIAVTNADGVDGDPIVALAELPDAGGGSLQKTERDSHGRLAGTSEATTSDLPEGDNQYFTEARADARAALAVADHVAQPDPHPQYATPAEAAAAAPVQSVNGKTGVVSLAPADVGLASGTTGQFWRGDGVWSNELTAGPIVAAPVAALTFRVTQPAFNNMAMGQWDIFGTHDGSVYSAAVTITPRAAAAWSASEKGTLIQFRTIRLGAASLSEHCRFGGAGEIAPGVDNSQSVGTADRRWSTVYAGTGTINTSDAREKTPVWTLSAAEIAAAVELGGEIGVYHWLAMVAAKGAAARQHIGMTVQRAIDVMQSHGLDPFAYGFICYDEWPELPEIRHEWPAQPQVVDDFGNLVREAVDAGFEVVQAHRQAGDRYSFRMDELLAFIIAGERAARQAGEQSMAAKIEDLLQRLTVAGL